MAHYVSSTAFGSTGIKTLNCGFQPVGYRLTVCQKYNTAQGYEHKSVGVHSSTNSYGFCNSTFQDTAGGKSINFEGATPVVVSHMERISGTITDVLVASHDSYTLTGFKINVTTANANYNIFYEAWD